MILLYKKCHAKMHIDNFVYLASKPSVLHNSFLIGIPTVSECQPKSFNQSNCLQVPFKLNTGHDIECWYHRRSKPETEDCQKMVNFSVSSCSLDQSNDDQVKDEFHQPLPKCDGNNNSIIPEWKFTFSQQNLQIKLFSIP